MLYQILEADDARIAEIEVWLDTEEAGYEEAFRRWKQNGYEGDIPVRGFRCNWDSAKRWRREGHTKMSILVVDGHAAGFLIGTDILEIKSDLRGKGYGRILAEHMVQTSRGEGYSVVKITIAPSSAESFWRCMGFRLVEEHQTHGNGIFAYKTLPRAFDLGDGERVAYAIFFFTEKERYEDEPKPFARFAGLGERLSDGAVQMPERAFCFNPEDDRHVDYFVKIELEGRVAHFDKAKYDSSTDFGVERDVGYDFFIERIGRNAAGAETM